MFWPDASNPNNRARQRPNAQKCPANGKTFSRQRQGCGCQKETSHRNRKENRFESPEAGEDDFDSNQRSNVGAVCKVARTPQQFEKQEERKYNSAQCDKSKSKSVLHPTLAFLITDS